MIVTVLGGTGGCALAALTRLLNDGHQAVAEKLTKLLSDKGVASTDGLTIVPGDATNADDLRKALVQPTNPEKATDMVLCGVGAAPAFKASITQPVSLDQPTLLTDVMRALLQALAQLQEKGMQGKPRVVVVSTTGISTVQDVPFLLRGLYHYILAVPHEDKKDMERQLREAVEAAKSPVNGAVVVRASLLTDGAGKGADNIRVGWEGSKEGPAIGYSIAREDVGAWIYEKLIKASDRDQWTGRMVTLTS